MNTEIQKNIIKKPESIYQDSLNYKNNLLKIKISTGSGGLPFLKQLKSFNSIWNNCQFFINQDIPECDFWVVYGGLGKEEHTSCPANGTLFITNEPPSVREYSRPFTDQFSAIITCHKDIKHKNKIPSQQSLPWWVGHKMSAGDGTLCKTYDELKNTQTPEKTKLASIIISNKTFTKGHKKRYDFLSELQKELGDAVDIFGIGTNTVDDKWDAIAPYKYHIVIENSSYPDYWTEKLSDTFLGESYPIYYGCPNIYDYFDKDSLSVFDIDKPKEAIDKIRDILDSDSYEKSKEKLKESKELILEKYQLFPILVDYANKNISDSPKIQKTLSPEKENFIKKIAKKLIKKIIK